MTPAELIALFDQRHPYHAHWSDEHKAAYAREWLMEKTDA